MKFEISIMAQSAVHEKEFAQQIEGKLGKSADLVISCASQDSDLKPIVFIDQMMDGLSEKISKIERKGRYLVLIAREIEAVPFLFSQGRVDDLIVAPFRTLELLSKLRAYETNALLHEVSRMSDSFAGVVSKLKEELDVASRLQKKRLPIRFPEVRGMKVSHRYLAGMKSGGDHFDLIDSTEKSQLSVFLSDSSSYGLSSAVLGALMRITLKLAAGEGRSSQEVVRKIVADLSEQIGPKDHLSLFFGMINRKDFTLNYSNFGDCAILRAPRGGAFERCPPQGSALTSGIDPLMLTDHSIRLEPADRLVLVSDGFIEVADGMESLKALLNNLRDADPKDLLNELTYCVKRKFSDRDDMADQDCTALVFDVDAKVLRLT